MFTNFLFKILNKKFINTFFLIFFSISSIILFFLKIFNQNMNIIINYKNNFNFEEEFQFFDLFLPEIFCFFWLLTLIFFSSIYSKFFYKTHSYNLKDLIKNLFRLILSILITMSFMYLRSYYFTETSFLPSLLSQTWTNSLHLNLIGIKIFICFLSGCLINFSLEIRLKTPNNNHMFKTKTKYSTGLFEYPIFFLFSCLMCNILLSANHLILVFLSIVGLSLCLYALIAFDKNSYSVEAAAKYFSIGSVASGLMLFGIFSFYYTSQTLFINELSLIWNISDFQNNLININFFFFAGLTSFIFGFFFKLSVFPCHMWAPDVYDGTSLLVTAFLLTVVKTAIFFYLIFFLVKVLKCFYFIWSPLFVLSGFISIIIGTFGALYQNKLKRFLAFTSMSQLGLSLISLGLFFDNNFLAISFSILNFIIYIFTSLVFFIILFSGLNNKNNALNKFESTKFSLSELTEFNTYFSFLLTLNTLSMAGIPPLLGFFPKYLILSLFSGYSPIFVLLLLLLHLVNTFNYLRLIQIFWFKKLIYFSYFNLDFLTEKYENKFLTLDFLSWLNLILILKLDFLVKLFSKFI